MHLEEEGGVTEISLNNIRRLVPMHGGVKFIFLSTYPDHNDPYTEIYFQDGFKWTATGFSIGYRGEGPHGLERTIIFHLNRTDITMDIIAGLDSGGGVCYLFTRGQGTGRAIMRIPGVMDCEYDIDVY